MIVTVRLVPGLPRPVWCDRCLATAADIPVYAFVGGAEPGPVGELRVCWDCDDPAVLVRQHVRDLAARLTVARVDASVG